jgi:hypothetical protein
MHGHLPFTPARVTAYGEDWRAAVPVLYVEGEVTQARLGGEVLRLHRRIESPIGGATLTIRDTVENLGATAWPQAMLYHFNLGYPAIGPESTVALNGRRVMGPTAFPATEALKTAVTMPAGNAERAQAVVATPLRDGRSLTVSFAFDPSTLPFLQVWHDLRPRSGVLAIEPCTSARTDDGRSGEESLLGPGETRRYDIEIAIAGEVAALGGLFGEQRRK